MKALALSLLLLLTACSPSDKWTKNRIVRVMGTSGMCTGEQVHSPHGVDYILTAAHCMALPHTEDSFSIKTESGQIIKRKIIAEDPSSDLLLLEGLPGVRGLEIGLTVFPFEPLHAITHGGNLDLYETRGCAAQSIVVSIPYKQIESEADEASCRSMPKQIVEDADFMGKTCTMRVRELVTTVSVRPGSSGGPLFNRSGELVGVASAMDSFGFGHFVTTSDIRLFLSVY